jgi:amino acid permease
MKKMIGVLLFLFGIVLIVFSIMLLVTVFDGFVYSGSSAEEFVHTLGAIVFPLLLTVLGRWLYRKGRDLLKNKPTTPSA